MANAFQGPRHADQIVRAASSLIATETGTFTVNPEMYKMGLSLFLGLPTLPTGTSPTLKVTVEGEDDHGEVEVTHTDNITELASAEVDESYPSTVVIDIPWANSANYKWTLTVGGTLPVYANASLWVGMRSQSRVP